MELKRHQSDLRFLNTFRLEGGKRDLSNVMKLQRNMVLATDFDFLGWILPDTL